MQHNNSQLRTFDRFPNNFDRDQSRILVTCPKGLSPFLRQEILDLGFSPIDCFPTGVTLDGTLADCMRLNLMLSTGHRVLFMLSEFSCTDGDDLHRYVSQCPWETLIDPSEYLSITSTVANDTIRDSRYANVRCKDGIVDRLVEMCGTRCNSGPDRTGVVIHLFWQQTLCRLFLDTSGESLARRGYRTISVAAPLQETLGAGIVHAMHYTGSVAFVNPMCGSGTLAIEAAYVALKRPPQILRTNFGFMHIKGFDQESFATIKKEHAPASPSKNIPPIIATDHDPLAVEAAQKNAVTAGVAQYITFHVCDFAQTPLPESPALIVMNPEYGFRIGADKDLSQVYKSIGSFFKHECGGYKGYVFTGNTDLVKHVGLKASRKTPFSNGSLDCRLYEYELYAGSR